jgi:hypothetical protein
MLLPQLLHRLFLDRGGSARPLENDRAKGGLGIAISREKTATSVANHKGGALPGDGQVIISFQSQNK